MSIDIDVETPIDLGDGRRVIPFLGGRFSGADDLNGRVLVGGADWQSSRSDGVIEIDAHYALLTTFDETIEIRSTGLRRVTPDVAQRISNGEAVDPDTYYFRTHIRLQTSAPRLARLNSVIAISTGQRLRDVVTIDVHEVL
jgi:hypothetical protein